MADDDATTIGTWYNAREQREILEPFDEALEEYGIDSRSAGIKRAQRLYTVFMEVINEASWSFANEHEERIWLQQAMRNEIRRDIERD